MFVYVDVQVVILAIS